MVCELQTSLFRIWTRVALSISDYDNYYPTSDSIKRLLYALSPYITNGFNTEIRCIFWANQSTMCNRWQSNFKRSTFANGLGDLGSIPGRVIPKTQKMVLDTSLLNTQHYKVRIKGKVELSREGVAPSPTPWYCSYRKGSPRVTLDYGRQLYFTLLTASLNSEFSFS